MCELIDLDYPPSKRIKAVIPEFHKVVAGSTVALAIGLQGICDKCPHFKQWLNRLESL